MLIVIETDTALKVQAATAIGADCSARHRDDTLALLLERARAADGRVQAVVAVYGEDTRRRRFHEQQAPPRAPAALAADVTAVVHVAPAGYSYTHLTQPRLTHPESLPPRPAVRLPQDQVHPEPEASLQALKARADDPPQRPGSSAAAPGRPSMRGWTRCQVNSAG